MSIGALHHVMRHSKATHAARLVMFALGDYANDEMCAYPAVKTIAGDTLLGERTVQRALRELELAGEIADEGLSEHETTRYRIIVGGGANMAPGANLAPEDVLVGDTASIANKPKQSPNVVAKGKTPTTLSNGQNDAPSEIAAVWDAYVQQIAVPNGLRIREMESAHKTLISNALRVRTIDEVLRAVEGLASSPHHKGQNDRRRKYLDLRYALKGNANAGESNGERIDKAGTWVQDPLSAILSGLSSEGRVILLREKKQVELALHNPGEAVFVSRAVHATAHLRDAWGLVAEVGSDGIAWRIER